MSDPRDRIIVPAKTVRRIVDRTMPIGSTFRITAEDLMLSAARMRRDGKSREAIMAELGASLGLGVTHDVMDRFLDRSEALLNQRIAEGKEPAETLIEVEVPDDEDDDDDG